MESKSFFVAVVSRPLKDDKPYTFLEKTSSNNEPEPLPSISTLSNKAPFQSSSLIAHDYVPVSPDSLQFLGKT